MRDIFKRLRSGNKEEGEKAETAGEPLSGMVAEEEAILDIAQEETLASAPGKMPISAPETITAPADAEEAAGESDLAAAIKDEEREAEVVLDQTVQMRASIEETAVGQPLGIVAEPDSPPALRTALRCHIGNIRSRNEDSAYMFTSESGGQEPLLPFGLYVVADGMGGHHAGHEASKIVSRLVAQHVLERIYLPMLRNEEGVQGQPQEPMSEVMLDAIQIANKQIYSPDPKKDSGTTLTAALVIGRRLYVAHIGDSRAYLLKDEKLKQVTTDHSYVRRLQDAGQLTEEEAAIHPQRNMLYKAVGQGGELEIDTFTQSLPQAGKLMLCSDGLWGLVPDKIAQEILLDSLPLEEMADNLIDLALKAGGHDNISVVLVDFSF